MIQQSYQIQWSTKLTVFIRLTAQTPNKRTPPCFLVFCTSPPPPPPPPQKFPYLYKVGASQTVCWLHFDWYEPYIDCIFIAIGRILIVFSSAWTLCAISPRCTIAQAFNHGMALQKITERVQARSLQAFKLVVAVGCGYTGDCHYPFWQFFLTCYPHVRLNGGIRYMAHRFTKL